MKEKETDKNKEYCCLPNCVGFQSKKGKVATTKFKNTRPTYEFLYGESDIDDNVVIHIKCNNKFRSWCLLCRKNGTKGPRFKNFKEEYQKLFPKGLLPRDNDFVHKDCWENYKKEKGNIEEKEGELSNLFVCLYLLKC
eukprot:TRINITY_DN208_c2_g3_i1.p2 TRINITY_DN208_c2_g3~~TRINITY_DN208_c2_g3_i1.p2  ORF type:complete len:145 (-),score=28.51 TRINITY_DN208_c2_g3_i1:241-654(-)